MSSAINESSSDAGKRKYDLIYGLDDKPGPVQAVYGALQHLLVMSRMMRQRKTKDL